MGTNKTVPAKCHPDRLNSGHGLCSECYRKDYYLKNKERIDKNNMAWAKTNIVRHNEMKRKCQIARYGLNENQYSIMFNTQEGKCAICGTLPGKRRLSIDHDHETGRVRCLLCTTCNKLRMGMNTLESAKRVVELLESTFDGRLL